MRRRTGPAVVLALLALLPATVPATATESDGDDAEEGELTQLGHTDLGGKGLNGDVAVVGTVAIVGAGYVTHTGYHTERYNPGPCIEVTAKVVDLTDARAPRVTAEIPMPVGVAAIDVDAIAVETPTFTGTLAAIALDDGPSQAGPTPCTPAERSPAFVDRGVLYYDITDPAQPRMLGRYMADQGPMDDVPANAVPCAPPSAGGAGVRCATGQHSVSLAQRDDGRVVSLSVEPIADFMTKPSGDVRVVDVTDPRNPTQLGAWPPLGSRPHPFSPNGCGPFTNSHSAEFYAGGRKALVAFMDGGLFDLDTTNGQLIREVSRFSYPEERGVEGNAGFVTATEVDGATVALLSEEDWFPTTTRVRIESPTTLAREMFACQGMPTYFDQSNQSQLYRRPNATITAEIVYGGRGCPARGNPANPVAEDPYPSDPRGRIVFLDTAKIDATQPDISNTACNNTTKINRAQGAGALAVLMGRVQVAPFSAAPYAIAWGGSWENLSIPGLMVDEGDGNALRAALCPRLEEGRCAGGETVRGSLTDGPGEWGGLRVLEVDPDTGMRQMALVHSRHGKTFPPPDLGVYAPGRAVARGERAYVAWHSDGLRVLDLGEQPPREVGHFVPPDTPDPSNTLPGKASVVGVALLDGNRVVITDQNSGLYVLSATSGGGEGAPLGVGLAVVFGGLALLVAAAVLVARRRRRASGSG
ncbi:MAG: hypothetical protein ACLGI2_16075 [Acidimicrobiia bacterium]